MNADQLKKLRTDALDRLGALLDAGQSNQLTALLKTTAWFHRYSLHNVCMIASQRPDATRGAGFQTWKTLGRFVRKGEKGIVILGPIVGRRSDAEDDDSKHVVGFPCGVRVRMSRKRTSRCLRLPQRPATLARTPRRSAP